MVSNKALVTRLNQRYCLGGGVKGLHIINKEHDIDTLLFMRVEDYTEEVMCYLVEDGELVQYSDFDECLDYSTLNNHGNIVVVRINLTHNKNGHLVGAETLGMYLNVYMQVHRYAEEYKAYTLCKHIDYELTQVSSTNDEIETVKLKVRKIYDYMNEEK